MLQNFPKLHREGFLFLILVSLQYLSKYKWNAPKHILLLLFSGQPTEEPVNRKMFVSLKRQCDYNFLHIHQTQPKLALHLTFVMDLYNVDSIAAV